MPSKTKGTTTKAHNRASSASSVKLNINAAFARTKSADKIKRNASDVQHHVGRNTSPQSRGHVSPAKRAMILQVDTGADDDEWVSSESGAVTPADYDEQDLPPSPQPQASSLPPPPPPGTTPRGDAPLASHADLPRVNTVTKFTTQAEDSPSSDSPSHDPPTPTCRATSSTHAHRRPPSMRSAHSARPHPLIRAHSHAPSTPVLTAAPPALSSSMAQVAPGSHVPSPIASPPQRDHLPPEMLLRSPASETYPHAAFPRLRRQDSHSSMASVATLPLPVTSTAATASMSRVHGERQRTHSHASISAALTSLTAARHPHQPSRAPSPVFPIAFPPVNPREDYAHAMLPAPLVPPHVSATAHQNPILEAWQRVARAKIEAGR